MRLRGGLPPFGRLAALIVSGEDRALTEAHAKALAKAAAGLGEGEGWSFDPASAAHVEIFGPAESLVAVVRARHRFRLLVKATRKVDIQGFLRRVLAAAPKPRGSIKVAVDIDPQSFM